jgi:hypothetical protein
MTVKETMDRVCMHCPERIEKVDRLTGNGEWWADDNGNFYCPGTDCTLPHRPIPDINITVKEM